MGIELHGRAWPLMLAAALLPAPAPGMVQGATFETNGRTGDSLRDMDRFMDAMVNFATACATISAGSRATRGRVDERCATGIARRQA